MAARFDPPSRLDHLSTFPTGLGPARTEVRNTDSLAAALRTAGWEPQGTSFASHLSRWLPPELPAIYGVDLTTWVGRWDRAGGFQRDVALRLFVPRAYDGLFYTLQALRRDERWTGPLGFVGEMRVLATLAARIPLAQLRDTANLHPNANGAIHALWEAMGCPGPDP